MSLKEEIQQDIKNSLKEKDELTSMVLRGLNAEISNKAIEEGKKEEGLNEEEMQKIVLREIKKRQDAKEQYKKGNRDDLAEKEESEIKILQKYAPEQMSEAELEKLVEGAIAETGASSPADTGKVIGSVMQKAGNDADGSLVSKIVREKLQ